jgi:uncharacterized membrane protein
MVGYALLELIHILSSTLLFGTGLGTAFYMWRTWREGEVTAIASVAANVVRADWLFTMPAVIIQPITGFLMLNQIYPHAYPAWIMVSLGLYITVGLCWLPVVWIQIKLARLSREAVENNRPLGDEYHRYMKIWFALGWPAFTGVLVIFYLMVFKPVW